MFLNVSLAALDHRNGAREIERPGKEVEGRGQWFPTENMIVKVVGWGLQSDRDHFELVTVWKENRTKQQPVFGTKQQPIFWNKQE